METEGKSLADYIKAFRRRKWSVFWTFLVLASISTTIAFVLPAQYRSSATVLIQQQEIPADMIRSTVTTFAEQRLSIIEQRAMTSQNLLKIIEEYDLYAEKRKKEPIELVLDDMRDDISMDMLKVDMVDPRSGRPMSATIAFTLSFDYGSPAIVQKVVNELASLFLQENIKTRTSMAEETTTFLREEAENIGAKISAVEEKLATFKEKNVMLLPENRSLNIQMLDRNEREIISAKQELQLLGDQKILLESTLAEIEPYSGSIGAGGQSVPDSVTRLKQLESVYLRQSANLGKKHPDMVKMKREIDVLQAEVGGEQSVSDLQADLIDIDRQLLAAKGRYSDDHPDVKALRRMSEGLREQIAEAKSRPDEELRDGAPTNPAYIRVLTQLKTVEANIESTRQKIEDFENKQAELEDRILRAPQVEREYFGMQREYQNAVARHNELKAKLVQAELGEALEVDRKGERFILIEPPQLPEKPVSPNRIAILVLGFVVSLAAGAASAMVAEAMDDSVRGARSVVSLLDVAPLGVIPDIRIPSDIVRKRRRRILILIAMFGSGLAVLALVHYFYLPLDIIWYAALRKLDIAQSTGGL